MLNVLESFLFVVCFASTPAPLLFMFMFLSGSRVPGVFSQTAERLPGPVRSRTRERRDREQKQKWCVN